MSMRNFKTDLEALIKKKNAHNSRMFDIVTKTWNPVTGCSHNCIYCWASRFATTKLKNTEKYRDGFIPKIHQKEFRVRFKGGIVFVSSMGDLFCSKVPDEWIVKVIKYVEKFPETYFLFLTKNPQRYSDFLDIIPENAILGATIETTDNELYSKNNISQAPLPESRFEAMRELDFPNKFISIEPILEFDLKEFVSWIKDIEPVVTYVGYDNYRNRMPEPCLKKTLKLIEELSKYTLVLRKTIRPAWHEKLKKSTS